MDQALTPGLRQLRFLVPQVASPLRHRVAAPMCPSRHWAHSNRRACQAQQRLEKTRLIGLGPALTPLTGWDCCHPPAAEVQHQKNYPAASLALGIGRRPVRHQACRRLSSAGTSQRASGLQRLRSVFAAMR